MGDKQGTILITTNYDQNKRVAILEISDNGKGITDKNKENLDPYFTTDKQGMGLGLAISSFD